MKKIFLSVAIAFLAFINLNAQDDSNVSSEPKFGVKGGYSTTILKVSVDGSSGSEDLSGFYIGVFGQFNLSEKIDLQPEINYGNYSQDGESTSILLVPVLFKYNANEEFSLLAGPQIDYLINEDDSEGLKRVGLGISLGASYDIDDHIFMDTRYSFGLSDRLEDGLPGFEEFDIKTKFNYFQIGLGYRF